QWSGPGGKYPELSFCGSKRCVEQFREWVLSLIPHCQAHIYPSGSIWYFALRGRYAVEVATLLYQGAKIALPRKVALATAFLDWRPVRRNHKHLTADDINGAFRDAGTWVGAAQLLGISYKGLQALRRYRKMLPPREPTPPRTDLTLERFAALKEEYGSLRK